VRGECEVAGDKRPQEVELVGVAPDVGTAATDQVAVVAAEPADVAGTRGARTDVARAGPGDRRVLPAIAGRIDTRVARDGAVVDATAPAAARIDEDRTGVVTSNEIERVARPTSAISHSIDEPFTVPVPSPVTLLIVAPAG
jgi:hypothetical protein